MEEGSNLVFDLARDLIDTCNNMSPGWSKAFYRFEYEAGHFGSTGSYINDGNIRLFDFMDNKYKTRELNETAALFFQSTGHPKGIMLVIVDDEMNFDVKFEYEDMRRWWITKLGGKSGLPEGL